MRPSELNPECVFKLALRNPTVHACLMSWRHGDVSWEQALIMAVAHLAHQNEKLIETATLRLPTTLYVNKVTAADLKNWPCLAAAGPTPSGEEADVPAVVARKRPCKTCEGKGKIYACGTPYDSGWEPCPDCR